jgi:hypothetical protein
MLAISKCLLVNLAAIFITPSSWGSQRAGYLPGIKHIFWRRCRGGKRRLLRGEFFARTSFTLFYCFALLYFILLASFYQKPKKIRILGSCFYLSAFSLLEWLLLKTPSCVTLLA